MAAYGGRALGKLVREEGEVAVKEAGGLEPRQDNIAVLPTQLPRLGIRATDSYQNHENTVCPPASLQFQGFQELIKTPPDDSPTGIYDFNFLLSNMSKDKHEDHTPKTVSSYSRSQFSGPSLMQDKMTCTTTNSYQMTPERGIQVEGGTSNRWKRIRKPYLEKKPPIRKAPQATPDPVPERKRTAPINPAYTIRKSRVASSVHMRPYRDRVIHLLALKDYKKPELLIRLQRDGITKNEKNSLGEILHQVANLNTQNFTYTLKDYVFKELQKDWPGYNEVERQSLELVLSRKVHAFQNASGTNPTESSAGSSTGETSSQDHFSHAAINLARRKVRISHVTTAMQSTSNGHLSNTSAKSAARLSGCSEAVAHPRPAARHPRSRTRQPVFSYPSPPSRPAAHLPYSRPPQPACSSSNSRGDAKGPETPGSCGARFSKNRILFGSQKGKHPPLKMLPSISVHMMYSKPVEKKPLMSDKKSERKFTQQEAKNQEHGIEMMGRQKTDPGRQGEGPKPNASEEVEEVDTASGKTGAAPGRPDYLANYVTISSSKQRQQYEQEFRLEYGEYQGLYDKMLTLSTIFVNLDSKRKHLSPDSKEYQDINKKISLEYQKMRQMNPNYCADKHRCQYLYDKLVHIKKLISDYDQQQVKP
ncbi:RNA polymerase II elongation factor ELL2-like [Ursus americanus]|uniref:RNA polymerase II elongation factor ELL2-like n=1 Tax=Ursus americanus TaxID=9643 RepID=UPI001E67BBDD|nr:RNA polymerase II elongation factor ELL2-like [Ursus americanus]